MDRLVRFNVIATSGRAVEAAGDVDTLLLDKTGTITFGNRMASDFLPAPGVTAAELAEAALIASLSDETPEGRSIVALASGEFGIAQPKTPSMPSSASPPKRASRASISARAGLRKGAVDAVLRFAGVSEQAAPEDFRRAVDGIARSGGTPLAVADGDRLLGAIHLKDVVKPASRSALRRCAPWASAPSWSPATTRSPPPPSPRKRVSMISSPRRRPKTSSPISAASSRAAA